MNSQYSNTANNTVLDYLTAYEADRSLADDLSALFSSNNYIN